MFILAFGVHLTAAYCQVPFRRLYALVLTAFNFSMFYINVPPRENLTPIYPAVSESQFRYTIGGYGHLLTDTLSVLSCRLSSYNLAGQVPSTCCSQFCSSGLSTSTCESVAIHADGVVLFGLHTDCWFFTLRIKSLFTKVPTLLLRHFF